MMPIYVLLLNIMLDAGFWSDSWLEGIIRSIYKRRGDPLLPENYRPLTIQSCFGKPFTSNLNSRIHQYLEISNILEENQASFMACSLIIDYILVLHAINETEKKWNFSAPFSMSVKLLIQFGGRVYSRN